VFYLYDTYLCIFWFRTFDVTYVSLILSLSCCSVCVHFLIVFLWKRKLPAAGWPSRSFVVFLSKSELLYDWRFTANHLSCRRALWDSRPEFFSTEHLLTSFLCNILPDERMGLSFTVAAGPRQRSHSQVRVPWDSWTNFTLSNSRFPQPGRVGPCIYIPQEQGGLVIPPGTKLHFVTSYGSQGYGGGIRPRHHMGWSCLCIYVLI
jgi:hypothetical protein